jgi:hypothetical protein
MEVAGDKRLLEYPETLPELGVQVQVKRAPATSDERLTFVGEFEQTAFVRGMVVRCGTGLT